MNSVVIAIKTLLLLYATEFLFLQGLYSGPLSYDWSDMQRTWVTSKILVLTYDQSLELRPKCQSRSKRVSACVVVNKEWRLPKGARHQSEPRYTCLWASFQSVQCFI